MQADPFVFHFVLTREGQAPAAGERLATASIDAADVARRGLRQVRRAIDAERVIWARRALAAGYGDGYGVSVVSERGFRRSLFPSVAVTAIAPAPLPVIVTPTGGRPDA